MSNTIMIVDSRPHDYFALEAACAEMETSLCFATTAEEALRMAAAVGPAIWLVNMDLPDMRGQDLMAEIKDSQPTQRVCLIADAYSAAAEIEARVAGAPVFLCKPIASLPAFGNQGARRNTGSRQFADAMPGRAPRYASHRSATNDTNQFANR